ncbi:DNA polymerase III subunit delta' [Pasteurellaceae bacterium 22721_9_1]
MAMLYPWLTPIYQQVTSAFAQGHGHHALLFRTEQGLGIEQLISALSQFLLCTEPHAPCDNCHSCNLAKSGNHPDYHVLAPIDNKDIGVDQVRDINEKVQQFAQQNGNKVVFIQGVERLTEAASNALLKTLEEPRPQTYFLLQADLTSALMPTIYSRCQVRVIPSPDTDVAMEWLQSQYQAETEQISTALCINYGRPLLALNCLEQGLLEKRREFMRAFWLYYQRKSPLELLPLFDKTLIFHQIDWIASFISDALKDKLGIQTGWINADLIKGVQQFSQKQQAESLLKANQIMQKVRSDLSEINAVNQELILLDGLTRLITEVFTQN